MHPVRRAMQTLRFPVNVIRIARLGRWERCRLVGREIRIESPNLPREHRLRPSVEYEVMNREHEDVLGVGQPEQNYTHQRSSCQVERLPATFLHERSKRLLAAARRSVPQVHDAHRKTNGRMDDLIWRAILGFE